MTKYSNQELVIFHSLNDILGNSHLRQVTCKDFKASLKIKSKNNIKRDEKKQNYILQFSDISIPNPSQSSNMDGSEDRIIVKDKRQIILDCSTEGTPDPEITWFKVRTRSGLKKSNHPILFPLFLLSSCRTASF